MCLTSTTAVMLLEKSFLENTVNRYSSQFFAPNGFMKMYVVSLRVTFTAVEPVSLLVTETM